MKIPPVGLGGSAHARMPVLASEDFAFPPKKLFCMRYGLSEHTTSW